MTLKYHKPEVNGLTDINWLSKQLSRCITHPETVSRIMYNYDVRNTFITTTVLKTIFDHGCLNLGGKSLHYFEGQYKVLEKLF